VATGDTPRSKIHREARVMCAAIVNSRGSHVIQFYLRMLRPIFSGQPLAALRNAALEPVIGGFRYTYADDNARRIIAEGLLMLVIGKWTDQRTAFGGRSARRGLCVAGLGVAAILRAVTPVGRKPYNRHTWGAGSSKADGATWLGDMARLERAGFALRKRLPAWRVNAWELGPTHADGKRYSLNRYWIGCVVSSRDPKAERRNRPVTPLAATLGMVALDPSSHAAGWDWADEIPWYAAKCGDPPPF
jgi:hypothetical protein